MITLKNLTIAEDTFSSIFNVLKAIIGIDLFDNQTSKYLTFLIG